MPVYKSCDPPSRIEASCVANFICQYIRRERFAEGVSLSVWPSLGVWPSLALLAHEKAFTTHSI